MRYQIILAPEAIRDLRRLRAHQRASVRDAIEQHLRHDPMHESQSRIKRLRGLTRPQYRLRVDEVRVFYDVVGEEVHVLAIVLKTDAQEWLQNVESER
jgi:mRNA interferase RelE/StbE